MSKMLVRSNPNISG